MDVGIKYKIFFILLLFFNFQLLSSDGISNKEYNDKSFKILEFEAKKFYKELNNKIKICEKISSDNILKSTLLNNISLTPKELEYTLMYYHFKTHDKCYLNELAKSHLANLRMINFVKNNYTKFNKINIKKLEKALDIFYNNSYNYTKPKIYFDKYVSKEIKEKVSKIEELNQLFNLIKSLKIISKEKYN